MKRVLIRLAIVLAILLPLAAFDHIYGLPNALGIEPTSLEEIFSRRRFDSAIWKRAEYAANEDVRIKMVDDLLKRHRLEGMTRQQIDELLGRPQPTTYFRDYEYVYYLGPERGFLPIDSEWLCLKFRNNIVTEARDLHD